MLLLARFVFSGVILLLSVMIRQCTFVSSLALLLFPVRRYQTVLLAAGELATE